MKQRRAICLAIEIAPAARTSISRLTCSNATRQVRRVRRVVTIRLFDHNQEAVHPMIALRREVLRPSACNPLSGLPLVAGRCRTMSGNAYHPDFEAATYGLGILLQRRDRGGMLSAAASRLQPCHDRWLGCHPFGNFGLGQPGLLARAQQFVKQREVIFQRVVFADKRRIPHPLLYHFIVTFHCYCLPLTSAHPRPWPNVSIFAKECLVQRLKRETAWSCGVTCTRISRALAR
jgi:hypothetical protein